MKIVVSYTKVYDEVIEVDDKFAAMIETPNAELHQELEETIYNSIPKDADFFAAYDEETGEALIAL